MNDDANVRTREIAAGLDACETRGERLSFAKVSVSCEIVAPAERLTRALDTINKLHFGPTTKHRARKLAVEQAAAFRAIDCLRSDVMAVLDVCARVLADEAGR